MRNWMHFLFSISLLFEKSSFAYEGHSFSTSVKYENTFALRSDFCLGYMVLYRGDSPGFFFFFKGRCGSSGKHR